MHPAITFFDRSKSLTECRAVDMHDENEERSELIGTCLGGRFRIEHQIAVGGTGVVFFAYDERDDRPVVVKTMRPKYTAHADLNRRLAREAEVARRVRHPGIAEVIYEGQLIDGSVFVVFEYIDGVSLASLLFRVGRLTVEQTCYIGGRVAAILQRAHDAGYVHRDVKPEHIVLCATPEGLNIRLIDFGVCAAATAPHDERERERGRVFGTPSYVSPEQAAGIPDVCSRADLFGLGATMYECLVGRVPFTGRDVTDLLRKIIRCDAAKLNEVRPDIHPSVAGLIDRAMERNPDDRFGSARFMARACHRFVASPADVGAELLSRAMRLPAVRTEHPTTPLVRVAHEAA